LLKDVSFRDSAQRHRQTDRQTTLRRVQDDWLKTELAIILGSANCVMHHNQP